MASFYLTLPSNTVNNGRTRPNTTSDFVTILPKKLPLPGAGVGEWVVGLSEIHFPFSWNNVDDGGWRGSMILIRSTYIGKLLTVRIPGGYYGTIQELMTAIHVAINRAIEKAGDEIPRSVRPEFHVKVFEGKVIITTKNIANFKLSPKLQYTLGYSVDEGVMTLKGQKNAAMYPWDLSGGSSAMFIQADCVENQVVGDSLAPLLRVVPLNPPSGVGYGQPIALVFNTPHYITVTKPELSSIEIKLLTDQGRPVFFNFGKSIVKLHFVRRSQRLL